MCALSNFDAKKYKKEILSYNYWEHIKTEKKLARVLPPDHPKRIAINDSARKLLAEIQK